MKIFNKLWAGYWVRMLSDHTGNSHNLEVRMLYSKWQSGGVHDQCKWIYYKRIIAGDLDWFLTGAALSSATIMEKVKRLQNCLRALIKVCLHWIIKFVQVLVTFSVVQQTLQN